MAKLVRLLFAERVMLPCECSKVLLSMLKLSFVSTDGSMVSTGSSGMVVALIGRLYWPFRVKRGGEAVLGDTGGESS
jgi:hypothetical protein